jgi:hypothetical protein
MTTEIVYLGHDNIIDLSLTADGEAVDLSSITKMTLSFGELLIESDNDVTDPIRWGQSEYDTGEVRLYLGDQSIPAGRYFAPLVVYDSNNIEGIVWGNILIRVKSDPEAS